jgi:hypothetical protein
MAFPAVDGGYQVGDGNLNEVQLGVQNAPATMTTTGTLTIAQLITGVVNGSPGSSAATYTLPTVALTEALLVNAKNNSSFDFSVCNIDGSGSGVITLAVGTGWTITGLATVAATAGTTHRYRAYKTGTGTWTLQTLA